MLDIFIRDGKFTQVGWVALALIVTIGCAIAWVG